VKEAAPSLSWALTNKSGVSTAAIRVPVEPVLKKEWGFRVRSSPMGGTHDTREPLVRSRSTDGGRAPTTSVSWGVPVREGI